VVYAAKGIIQSSITARLHDCCSRLQYSCLVSVTLLLVSHEKSASTMQLFVNKLLECFLSTVT